MTHWASRIRRAARPHICERCGRRIDVGEHYTHASGMDGRTAWSWATCEHCTALLPLVLRDWHEEEYGDDVIETWEPNTVAHQRLQALAVKWQWRRFDGSLYPVPQVIRELCGDFYELVDVVLPDDTEVAA